MSKLLYIQASPRGERSKSSQVAQSFIESYKQSHPDDEISLLNVFDEKLPTFDGFAVQAKYNIMHGKDHSEQQREAWSVVEKIISQFTGADKYLVSVPMWNFSVPYRLKQYLDIIMQPGYTFGADENGYFGLVKDKPISIVYARGGDYPVGSEREVFDMQKKYLELAFGLMGFADFNSIIVEPTLQGGPETAKQAVLAATEEAQSLAMNF